MAAKKPASKTTAAKKSTTTTKGVSRTTGVRNSPIPKKPAAKSKSTASTAASVAAPIAKAAMAVTHEMIARRAYEISQSGMGGSELDNWLRAERELRGV